MREISNAMQCYVNSLIHGWALSNISQDFDVAFAQ